MRQQTRPASLDGSVPSAWKCEGFGNGRVECVTARNLPDEVAESTMALKPAARLSDAAPLSEPGVVAMASPAFRRGTAHFDSVSSCCRYDWHDGAWQTVDDLIEHVAEHAPCSSPLSQPFLALIRADQLARLLVVQAALDDVGQDSVLAHDRRPGAAQIVWSPAPARQHQAGIGLASLLRIRRGLPIVNLLGQYVAAHR